MNVDTAPRAKAGPGPLLIGLAYVGFVSLGLPDALVGVAWPSIRDDFRLPQGALGLVFVASGIGYFLTSFFSGRLTRAMGIGLLLAASTAMVALAMAGFAFSTAWPMFVAFAVVHGFGSGAIDASLNGYAAENMSARHMNWLHACYCFGAMIGPIVMTAVLGSGRAYSTGYLAVGAVLLTLSAMFLATRPMWGGKGPAAGSPVGPAGVEVPTVGTFEALGNPSVLLQVLIFFLYTGVEMALSQWAFTVLTESRGVSTRAAGLAPGLYWGCIGAGRVFFGAVVHRFDIDRMLRVCLLAAGLGAILFALPMAPAVSFAGLAIAGFGLAPMYPCLMTRTPRRLGPSFAEHAIGFQVGGAMIGAAAIPGALGLIAGRLGLESVPIGTAILAGALWVVHEALIRRPDAA